MITYDMIIEAQNFLVQQWKEDGKDVIVECLHATPFNQKVDAFLDECSCCGGNWNGLLLSGIKKVYPKVYNAIPEDMGNFSWACLCYVLLLCGVDTSCD